MGLGSLLWAGPMLKFQRTVERLGQIPISMRSGSAWSKQDLSQNTMSKSGPQNCLPGPTLTQFSSWVLGPSTVLGNSLAVLGLVLAGIKLTSHWSLSENS